VAIDNSQTCGFGNSRVVLNALGSRKRPRCGIRLSGAFTCNVLYLKDGSRPLGNIYCSSAHLSVPDFCGQAGHEKVSSLLKEVSPDSSSKTIHNKLKEDAIINVLTHEDDAMIHYLLAKVQFNISNNSSISQMHKPENHGNYMNIFAARAKPPIIAGKHLYIIFVPKRQAPSGSAIPLTPWILSF
jgi:hypothetical protein